MSRIILTALGGLDQVGARNCLLLETKYKMLMLDCGWGLEAKKGNLLDADTTRCSYPDLAYLATTRKRLRAVALTHAHLDHIRGVEELARMYPIDRYPNFRPLILGSPLTLHTLKRGFANEELEFPYITWTLLAERVVTLGPSISIMPISVPHSVPESLGLSVYIRGKKILYLGDFKLNDITAEKTRTFKAALQTFRRKGVDVLLLEATNVLEEGSTPAEPIVWEELRRIIAAAQGRVIIATFSSHVERLNAVIDIAQELGRPVYVAGANIRAFLRARNIEGWTPLVRSNPIIPEPNAVILATGCQAEVGMNDLDDPGDPLERASALVRAAFGKGVFHIRASDTIVMAADPIPDPGIIGRITELLDNLSELAGKIYVSINPDLSAIRFPDKIERADVHCSGHASRGDLKYVLETVRPKLVVPVHADRARREALGELAAELKINSMLLETSTPVTL